MYLTFKSFELSRVCFFLRVYLTIVLITPQDQFFLVSWTREEWKISRSRWDLIHYLWSLWEPLGYRSLRYRLSREIELAQGSLHPVSGAVEEYEVGKSSHLVTHTPYRASSQLAPNTPSSYKSNYTTDKRQRVVWLNPTYGMACTTIWADKSKHTPVLSELHVHFLCKSQQVRVYT